MKEGMITVVAVIVFPTGNHKVSPVKEHSAVAEVEGNHNLQHNLQNAGVKEGDSSPILRPTVPV